MKAQVRLCQILACQGDWDGYEKVVFSLGLDEVCVEDGDCLGETAVEEVVIEDVLAPEHVAPCPKVEGEEEGQELLDHVLVNQILRVLWGSNMLKYFQIFLSISTSPHSEPDH